MNLATIAWPLVVLILVGIALFLFKKPISNKIAGINKIDGWKLGFENKTSNQSEISTSTLIDDISREFDTIITKEREQFVIDTLGLKEVTKPEETVKKLITYIAVLDIMIDFDKHYWHIYGSQLSLLNYVNSHTGTTDSLKMMFYDEVKKLYPSLYANYTFEQYLEFLTYRNLIVVDTKTTKCNITKLGRAFLTYLVKNGNNQSKEY